MKFRKKPVVIEAFQITRDTRRDNRDWPEWLNRAWNQPFEEAGAVSCADFPNSDGTDQLVIRTLEGVMYVGWGDWIIRGVKGELYACKPDIFALTYEPEDARVETDKDKLLAELAAALEKAHKTFARYAVGHYLKMTAVGDAKARENEALASEMYAALSKYAAMKGEKI